MRQNKIMEIHEKIHYENKKQQNLLLRILGLNVEKKTLQS